MNRYLVKIGIFMLTGVYWTILFAAGTEEERMTVFPMSDKEETCVQVQSGQNFSLKFVTSPGTGYGWELAAPLDEKMIVIVETRNEEANSGLLGASEYEIWICRALAAGCTEITLKYVRPWEKEASPLKTHCYKVQIH
ncbi:MAG: protease inhibitor I42 family protein [Chrysiogenia bacterium]